MGLPGDGDDLPTPIGKQTGEPIEDKDDLLDVTIDLKSNTIQQEFRGFQTVEQESYQPQVH